MNFSIYIFLIFAQNIDCRYTLEPPLCFGAKIRKICIPLHTPVVSAVFLLTYTSISMTLSLFYLLLAFLYLLVGGGNFVFLACSLNIARMYTSTTELEMFKGTL